MKIGDLVEYEGTYSYGKKERDLGTVIRDDHHESDNHCYIVWHTTDNEGWWDTRNLRVVSRNENR